MKKILYTIALIVAVCSVQAANNSKDWNIDVRAGYAIGGTVPLGFPAEVRALNGFTPKFNIRLGATTEHHLNDTYGIQTGIMFDHRGFKSDVQVKNYDVVMRQGGERIEGPFTGNVVMNIVQTGFTVPLQATWHFSEKGKLAFGPYVQFLLSRKFEGYAYGNKVYDEKGNWNGSFDAYLRRDEPRGEKIEIGDIYTDAEGNEVNKRGTFDGEEFNDFLRWFQYGVDLSCDYYLSNKFGVFADLSYGFNSAATSKDGNPINMGLHPLYFTVGVTYRLR